MESVIALLTLIALEVILGLDNVIFISIIASRLPADQQKKARVWGLDTGHGNAFGPARRYRLDFETGGESFFCYGQ